MFIQSSPFARAEARYSSCGIEPLTATQDTRDLVSAAGAILTRIYKPGIDYAKAGVMLSSMTDGTEQLSLFDERPARRGSEALMKVMDRFNKEHRGSLFLACEGIHQDFRGSRPCCPHGIPLAGMSYLSSKPDVHAGVTRHGQFRKEK